MKHIDDEMYSIGNAVGILPAQRSVSVIERIKGLLAEEFRQQPHPTVWGANGGEECTISVEPNAEGTGCTGLALESSQGAVCAYLPPAIVDNLAKELLESIGGEA